MSDNMGADPTMTVIRQTAHSWCVKVRSGSLSKSEEMNFQSWLAADPRHAAAYDRALTVTQAFRALSSADFDVDVIRPSLREHFVDAIKMRTRLPARLLATAFALCGLILVLGLYPALEGMWTANNVAIGTARYTSGVGQTKTITLMDGSSATLAPATELNVQYTGMARRVELVAGSALFDVVGQPERPFTVAAGLLKARALGTVFEARNNGGVARIAVAEGRVRVSFDALINGTDTAIPVGETLGAGQQISATAVEGLRSPQDIAKSQVAAWRSGRLDYVEATLAELVSDADRYAPQRIYLVPNRPELAALKVTASFNGDNVSSMLDALVALFPIRVIEDSAGDLRIEYTAPAQ